MQSPLERQSMWGGGTCLQDLSKVVQEYKPRQVRAELKAKRKTEQGEWENEEGEVGEIKEGQNIDLETPQVEEMEHREGKDKGSDGVEVMQALQNEEAMGEGQEKR